MAEDERPKPGIFTKAFTERASRWAAAAKIAAEKGAVVAKAAEQFARKEMEAHRERRAAHEERMRQEQAATAERERQAAQAARQEAIYSGLQSSAPRIAIIGGSCPRSLQRT